MRFRRIRSGNPPRVETEVLRDGAWVAEQAYPSPFGEQWELEAAMATAGPDMSALLPFRPLSFRDFMLYEKHVVDAGRGYAKRFLPKAYPVVRIYEKLLGRPFPALKPSALWYREPIYYMGNHLTFVPSGTPVRAPAYTQAFDYELEIGFVLKKPLFNATEDEALDAIGAFVVLNDFSARDVQRAEMQSGFGPQKAKHFLSSMSAVAVTADEVLPRINELTGTVHINDALISSPTSAGMRYSLGEVLARASREEHLFAGELFGTGTLPGGTGIENGHWLKSGDRLRLAIAGIGEIEHQIS